MKEYQLIYADPPWKYRDKAASGARGAVFKYPVLTVAEMAKWKIPAAKDSVLLMWCTYPMLPEGLDLMKAWMFTFKTVAFTWVKTNKDGSLFMGMGGHTRGNAEIVLLGTKGKGLPRQHCGIRNTQLHPRLRHSEKPAAFRDDIVRLYGENTRRLEMFARQQAEGWDVWGNEVECDIDLVRTKAR